MTVVWMGYGLVAGALVAVAAWGLDQACRTLSLPRRWVWIAALGIVVALVGLAPGRRGPEVVPVEQVAVGPGPVAALAEQGPEGLAERMLRLRRKARTWVARGLAVAGRGVPEGAEQGLAVGWAASSALLLGWLGAVHWRYARRRRCWPAAEVAGTRVRLAPDAGPAVMGLVRPEIVVPRWLVCMGAGEQRLVLAHEREHVRAGDPVLLTAGWVAAALLPWHPAAWWMLSRLRLAVELDCDARVLRQGVQPRDYGSLLIEMAGRCSGPRVGAPALADETYHLERRLTAMKTQIPRFAGLRGSALGLAAATALLAACEAKLPTAAEMESMDVRAVEFAAGGIRMEGVDHANAVYSYDGAAITAEAARALTPEQIGAFEITNTDGAPSQIRITSREAAARAGTLERAPGKDAVRMTIRSEAKATGGAKPIRLEMRNGGATAPTESSTIVGGREFTGILVIDGVRAEPSALRSLNPDQIEKVEVIKGSAATKLFDDPAAANGVMRITMRKAKR